MKFRLLKADEIECRVGTVKKDDSGFSLLLYKDARVDQKLLDETVGAMNWQKHYSRDNANCIVSIWDAEKKMWIEKEDVGTESNTEAEKGLASDSFKRACFNWGIGRELYTAPFIWIKGKCDKYAKYRVKSIAYDEDRNISALKIVDENNKVVFEMGKSNAMPEIPQYKCITPEQKAQILAELNRTKVTVEAVCKMVNVKSIDDISEDTFPKLYKSMLTWETR